MPNLALCTHELPNGQTCRQPRLRDQQLCRFHIRNAAEAEHDEFVYQFYDELDAMDLPELLETLQNKLQHIRCTLRPYHEARMALRAAIDRLKYPHLFQPEPQPDPTNHAAPKDLDQLIQDLMKCIQ